MDINSTEHNIPIVGITMGDYNGIGPEVLIKALSEYCKSVNVIFLIIGSFSVIKSINQKLNSLIDVMPINEISDINLRSSNIFLLDIFDNINVTINYGTIEKNAGLYAAKSIERGIELALENSIQALVTAPISKKSLSLAGYKYPGHTEMLAELTGTNDYMMMLLADSFRVGLVTTHCAIKDVSSKLKKETIYQKIEIANRSLIHDFCIDEPCIAVTSLNPHAADGGLFGDEEEKIIIPAIMRAKNEGMNVSGPFPADSLFAREKLYDVYIAMYHDQGLVPFKMRAFGKGVNFTAGLPIIRTSPDHGTAFNIAGKFIAESSSMKEALKNGYALAKNRTSC